MTKMRNRGLKHAIRAAGLSDFKQHKVGAALFYKNKLLNIGWNRKKSHPLSTTEHSQHAEFSVLIGVESAIRCTLYIARLTRTGKLGIARPCEICQGLISSKGIRQVFYTNNLGRLEKFNA